MSNEAGAPRCRVRLTEDAVSDLHRLHRKDPNIVRAAFAKMLLLERSTSAGEPLMGALVGYRKLIVGDRDWRIVWRETTDNDHNPVLDIAEVWAAGARSDSDVYTEMRQRVAAMKSEGNPIAIPLSEVVERMGRLYEHVEAHPEPVKESVLPGWLAQGLKSSLGLEDEEISALSQEEAQAMMTEHWSRRGD